MRELEKQKEEKNSVDSKKKMSEKIKELLQDKEVQHLIVDAVRLIVAALKG